MGASAIDPVEARKLMQSAGVKPLEPFDKNRSPWRSLCLTCNRIVTPSFANVRNGHAACRYCAKGGVSETEALSILKKLKVKPLAKYPGFKIPWRSECLVCQREIKPRLSVIIQTQKACNYCNRRVVDPLEAANIAKSSGAFPLEPYPGPGRWKCRCTKCKRTIFPTLRRMRNGQNPCGWCARVRIDPEEAKRTFLAAGLRPVGKYPGANVSWKAVCENCGEQVERKLTRLQAGRYACAFCSGRKLKESVAKKLMTDAGAKPKVPFPGIYKKWSSTCLICFRTINPSLSNVRQGHSPCVYCSGKKVDSETANKFALTKGLRPLTKYPGATKRWKVNCLKCNRDSTVSWVTLQLKRKNAGCSSCTEFGFKPHEPAYLYLISNTSKNAHKVGIGNKNARRIEKHIKNGWQVYKVYEYRKGASAHKIEQSILDWLRNDLGVGPAFRTGDGWTETVSASEISLSVLNRKVKEYSRNQGLAVNPKSFY
jgi:hypothetical protein